ncbi:hypothetical protein M8C21_021260 [Ambrosia artemisiifolia]|uniref:Uncharacterized protein n=1 Tax=Ambrosia artemisiifolia TaxID=4212 RepID=A0AAD5D8R3_AMBAR|nr:hypothetical protein M8C21_021260 [Ambrosia artemisiifolia]
MAASQVKDEKQEENKKAFNSNQYSKRMWKDFKRKGTYSSEGHDL